MEGNRLHRSLLSSPHSPIRPMFALSMLSVLSMLSEYVNGQYVNGTGMGMGMGLPVNE